MAGVNSHFSVSEREGNWANIHMYFSRMCCVVTELVYANTVILFNLDEQWLLEYLPQFQRIVVNFSVSPHSSGL